MTAAVLSEPLGDLPPLLAQEIAALHAAAFQGLERPYTAAELTRLVDGRSGFVICLANRSADLPEQLPAPLSGFVLYRTAGDEAEIVVIAVAPVDLRRGHGMRLLTAAESAAAGRGVARMFLEVAEGNSPARALYAAAGYRQVGRRRAYYKRPGGEREDALLLTRDLVPPEQSSDDRPATRPDGPGLAPGDDLDGPAG